MYYCQSNVVFLYISDTLDEDPSAYIPGRKICVINNHVYIGTVICIFDDVMFILHFSVVGFLMLVL